MHRGYSTLMAGLLALALAPFPDSPASASCAAPYLTHAGRLVLERGGHTAVQGRAFVDGCRDTMSCSTGLGCQSCAYDEPPEEPMTDVGLHLRQRGRTWTVAVADARTAEEQQLGWVTWTFEVPAGVDAGAATLVADGAAPVRVRVR